MDDGDDIMAENKNQIQDHFQPDEAYQLIRNYVIDAQKQVYSSVNSAMVTAYWNIGKEIYEVCGDSSRATYGKQVLEELSERLSVEFGKGFDARNLRNMRQFYLAYPKWNTVCSELSWSHYRLLMRVEDHQARLFYTSEAVKSGWSVRQLQRQINTMYYHRILASKDKKSVAEEIDTTVPKPSYEKIIKDPYVLEFLDLPANEHYYESNLEQALIDLKMDDLTHQDIGQMQMYVNYYTRELMNEGDNPPIGILLCAEKSDTLVKYTLPEDNNQIYAAKYMPYMPYMPTEEELRREMNLDEFKKIEEGN